MTIRWEYRYTVLTLAVAAMLSTMVARISLSPLIPRIMTTFDVDKAAVGLALSGMWAAYSLLQLPSGVLSEQYGERRVILLALGLTSLGTVLVAASPSYLFFLLFTICLGVGTGLYFVVGTVLLSGLFDERRGTALGLHAGASSVGGLITPVLATYIAVRHGWRAGVLLGTVSLAVMLAFAWWIKPTPPENTDVRFADRVRLSTVFELLRRPVIAFTTIIAILLNFSWQAFASFFPTFLVEYHAVSQSRASLIFAAIFAVSIACFPGLGRLSDRYGRDYVLAGGMAAGVLGYGVFFLEFNSIGVVVGVPLVATGISYGGVLQSRLMDNFGSTERGTGFGLVRTLYMTVSASGSVVTGTLASLNGWPLAYGLVVGLMIVAMVSLLVNRAFDLGL